MDAESGDEFDWKPAVKNDLLSCDKIIHWQKRVAVLMLASLLTGILATLINDDYTYRRFPDQYLHLVISIFLMIFHSVDTYHSRSSLRQIIYALSDLDKISLSYSATHPQKMDGLRQQLHDAIRGLYCPYVSRIITSIATFGLLLYVHIEKPYTTKTLFVLESAAYVLPVVSVFWNTLVLYYVPKHSCYHVLPGDPEQRRNHNRLLYARKKSLIQL